jgi:hypothetical protein
MMAKYYQDYINVFFGKWQKALKDADAMVEVNYLELYKGTLKDFNDKIFQEEVRKEVDKNKTKLVEAYNLIAANYANTDKVKAKEYFNKTLALDPTNQYATESLATLK